jgi:hypothetical protein
MDLVIELRRRLDGVDTLLALSELPTQVQAAAGHLNPDGQLKLPRLWSRKILHRVKQDEVEFYSSFVFCARASAASLSR